MRILNALALVALVASVSVAQPVARCPGSPNQCSLHGSCVLNRLGESVCNCQWGYHGSDCAKKMCPHGVDPLSPLKQDKKLRLVVSGPPALRDLPGSAASQYALTGKFILSFHAHSVELETPLDDLTGDACARVFRRFQNLASVSCDRVEFSAPASAVYDVTIHAFPVYPIMNNLYRHNGDPSASAFWCDGDNVQVTKNGEVLARVTVQCRFEAVDTAGVKPYDPCSHHGLCNDHSGLCTCDDGYYGDNCANNKDEEDILVAPSHGPFFQGNVLRVSAKREKSTDFNLIKADINGATVFSMDGTGDVVVHDGSLYLKDGDLVLQDGQLRVQKGGVVALDGADLKLHNGRIHVVSTEDDAAMETVPLLRLDLAGTSSRADFVRFSHQNNVLVRVTSAGTVVVHDGGLEILKGGLKVHRGGLQVLTDGVRILQGGLEVSGNDLRVQKGNIAVDGGSLTVASTPSTKPRASDAVLTVEGSKREAPLISASVTGHGSAAFEVLGSGETRIQSGGLKVVSGGIDIASGGQVIQSGGLVVQSGGIVVENGAVTTRGGFNIEDGGLHVQNDHTNGAVLSLSSSNAHYAGSMLEFTVNQSIATDPPFRLIEALAFPTADGIPETVFSVESDGRLTTRGDISTLANGRIVSAGALVSEAQVVFSHIQILAGEVIEIPSTNSYVQITDDGAGAANTVRLDRMHAYAGQLLVLQNEDAQALGGDVSVKPSAAAIYVFDGRDWRALTAASFDTSVITGVTTFEAANDLNVGDVKLTVQHLQVASQRAGFVAVYGKGGELTHDETLKFDAAQGVLSVDKLDARRLSGRIDMTESELVGVEIVGGHISNVNLTDLDMVEVSGELFVERQAFFGAGITVDGQVMGSGAYIDASDARFKKDIEDMDGRDALRKLSQLQGVEYAYRTDAFPSRGFGTRRELGFLAQQVENVVPQVVEEDADGFKYVAYARLVPVVVEAAKELERENKALRTRVDILEQELETLRALVLETRAAVGAMG